jgi:hypothetical protein
VAGLRDELAAIVEQAQPGRRPHTRIAADAYLAGHEAGRNAERGICPGTGDRLREENEALRDLLRAVVEAASPPFPATDAGQREWDRYYATGARRAEVIAVYAQETEAWNGNIAMAVLRDRAGDLRKEAARPLRYTPAGGEPAGGAK